MAERVQKRWTLDEECALVDFMAVNSDIVVKERIHLAAEALNRTYNSVLYHWYREIVPELISFE